MAIKTGASTRIGAKLGGTFGTEVAAGAGNKLEVRALTWGENAAALRDNPIGAGIDMDNDSIRGATEPSVKIEKVARFNDAGKNLVGLFFGADSVSAGTSAYTHSVLYEATRNQKFATMAWDAAAGSTIALASCTPTKVGYKFEKFPNYLQETIELLGNAVNYASSTNTSSTLGNVTVASTIRTIPTPSDSFRINLLSAAALASPTDVLNVTSVEISYEYPVTFPDEMKGSAGNGQPIADGDAPLQCTVTITTRGMDDPQFRIFINSQTSTFYKADLTVTSSTNIGATSIPYKHVFNFPCLVQVEDPKYDLSSTKQNPVTIKFKALAPASASTGMTLSTYPHMLITNDLSTSFIA
jgi:hypothetical protein